MKEARKLLDHQTVKIDSLLVHVQDEKIKLKQAREKLYKKLEDLEVTKVRHQAKIRLIEEKLEKQTAVNLEMNAVLKWGKRFENLANSWLKDSSNKNKSAMIGRFVKMMKERSGEIKVEEKKQAVIQKTATNRKGRTIREIWTIREIGKIWMIRDLWEVGTIEEIGGIRDIGK